MRLYIPNLGDELKLTADWIFDLYNEVRNETLMHYIGDSRDMTYTPRRVQSIPCTIPAGSVLCVGRIYIRKGQEDFNSVTFVWKNNYIAAHEYKDPWYTKPIKIPRKMVRFWAKLDDVNKIEFDENINSNTI